VHTLLGYQLRQDLLREVPMRPAASSATGIHGLRALPPSEGRRFRRRRRRLKFGHDRLGPSRAGAEMVATILPLNHASPEYP
jgi:hypothetical protein